jgi:UDPglucose 6-dehydrogenase
MRISIIGTGYVGLVTGACLAELGNDVQCQDIDRSKIDLLREGCIPIHEAGLADLVACNRAAGRLSFSADIPAGVSHADILFIAVGTPPALNGAAALDSVLEVARAIGRHIDGFKAVVVKSTVPVGTAGRVRSTIEAELAARGTQVPFAVLSNPEFLKEGSAVADFLHPHRIVVGCDDDECEDEDGVRAQRGASLVRQLFAPFQQGGARLLWMSSRAAEFTKYAANAMLATRVSFMNEMANLAEALGVDIEAVREGIGSDPRIGNSFLQAGCGYGGSCLPKDVQALRHSAHEHGCRLLILEAVEQVNQRQKHVLVDKILRRYGENLDGRRFAIWGLAFKPDTDDMREAPSRVLVRDLLTRGASLVLHDPVAMTEAQRVLGADLEGTPEALQRLRYVHHCWDALPGADALVIATEWQHFRMADIARVKRLLGSPVIFDGRNLYPPQAMAEAGFEYHGIGRCGPSLP